MSEYPDFVDLTGDPVYDYLKTKLNDGNVLIAGRIDTKKMAKPNEARKTITVIVQMADKKRKVFVYNYKKFERRFL
jgi:hypothetical protein